MTEPLVSVAMVICNADRFLGEAIESVLAQTFHDFEFIIVDFGSTDSSRTIASEYAAKDARISLHVIPNCALPKARNVACSFARGKYIAVMDADDICVPDRLMSEVSFMEKSSGVAIVGSATEWIDARGRSLGVQTVPCNDTEIRNTLPSRCPFWHPTVLLRSEAFRLVEGYREAFMFAHDYDLELRLAERFDCANLPDVLLKYRIHPAQVSFRKQRLQTLCKLAAQTSAVARKIGAPDRLAEVSKIDEALLTELGISETAKQNALVVDFRNWTRSMIAAQEFDATRDATRAILTANLGFVERWQIADLYLILASMYWKQAHFWQAVVAFTKAFFSYPPAIRHPFNKQFGLRRESDESRNKPKGVDAVEAIRSKQNSRTANDM